MKLPEPGAADTFWITDLTGYCHRYFHTPGGEHWAGRQTADMIGKILRTHRPAFIACAVDVPWPTFRHEILAKFPKRDNYKAGRTITDRDRERVKRLVGEARELIDDVYGVRTFGARGFEADDVLATLAHQGRARGLRTIVHACDKDMMQLIDPPHVIMHTGKETFGTAEVVEKFGVEPAMMADFQAIAGDSVDAISGIQGVGPVGAVKVLKQFGSLLEAVRVADSGKGIPPAERHPFYRTDSKLWAKFADRRAEAELMLSLTRLRVDVPLDLDWEALRALPP